MCPSILLTVSSFVSTGTGEKNGHGKIKLLENRFSSWQYYSLKDNSHQSPSDNLRSTKPAELTKDGMFSRVSYWREDAELKRFFFFFPRPKGQSPNSFAAKVRCSQLGQRKSLLTGSPNGPELEEKMTASQAPRNVTSVTLLLFNSFIVFDIMAAFSQRLLGGGGGGGGGLTEPSCTLCLTSSISEENLVSNIYFKYPSLHDEAFLSQQRPSSV